MALNNTFMAFLLIAASTSGLYSANAITCSFTSSMYFMNNCTSGNYDAIVVGTITVHTNSYVKCHCSAPDGHSAPNLTFVCTSSGVFKPSPEGKRCPEYCELPVIDNGTARYIANESNIEDSIIFNCKSGFVLVGEEISKCQNHSLLSDPPSCKLDDRSTTYMLVSVIIAVLTFVTLLMLCFVLMSRVKRTTSTTINNTPSCIRQNQAEYVEEEVPEYAEIEEVVLQHFRPWVVVTEYAKPEDMVLDHFKSSDVVPEYAEPVDAVPECVKLGEAVPKNAKPVVPECAKLEVVVLDCAKPKNVVPEPSKPEKVVPECANPEDVVSEPDKLEEAVPKYAKPVVPE